MAIFDNIDFISYFFHTFKFFKFDKDKVCILGKNAF